MSCKRNISISIDRGGTFTDCFGLAPDPKNPNSPPKQYLVKLLSVDTKNYDDANVEGIRRILELATGDKYPRNQPIDTSRIASLRLGTTVATNALLERNGEPCALVITKGFKDLLHIGNQSRPKIFDLAITCPEVLYSKVIEVEERVTLLGYTCASEGSNLEIDDDDPTMKKGITGEPVHVLQPINMSKLRDDLKELYATGIRSIAVCLMHSFLYPQHENQVAAIAKDVGFTDITTSASLMPMIKIVPRGQTCVTDAYLTPIIQRYLRGFIKGFTTLDGVRVEFMQSDGGLTPMDKFSGYRAILSGPAGGVVGYAQTSYSVEDDVPVIGFDMGGTSTDVSRFDGHYEHTYETTTAGITVVAPQLDIHTVAAGGSSRLFFRNGMFVVGPESAGSQPGPVCYRKGGPLAITDANLFLGRLSPAHFPSIFGPNEDEPLDVQATRQKIMEMTESINDHLAMSGGNRNMTPDEVAFGFVRVANESMSNAIRAITQTKGHDTTKHILSCFGGAGGQHACAIARNLGIRSVYIHRYSSILSAYGLSLADLVTEMQEPAQVLFDQANLSTIQNRIQVLQKRTAEKLISQGFSPTSMVFETFLNLRYDGTDTSLMTLQPNDSLDFKTPFEQNYVREFGFKLDRPIIVDDIRIRGIGKSSTSLLGIGTGSALSSELKSLRQNPIHISPNAAPSKQSVYFESTGRIETPVFLLSNLQIGSVIAGPAILLDSTTTILVIPNAKATITTSTVVIDLDSAEDKDRATKDTKKNEIICDPIQLSLFASRFMNIAHDMGRTLQKTSVSTNIKERLDFSCALFSDEGHLVANAPHIPVHLGSMQEAVKYQLKHWGSNLKDGDVLVSNHPQCGGSHLPDITVITPVYDETSGKIVFFVASRGHHADIGGISPGSMPPHSKELYQEGAAIKSFKLVEHGKFQEEGIKKLLLDEPAKYPGCSGTRNLSDNISDLKAQVAANQRGIILVRKLIKEYGIDVVQAYMRFIRENAEQSVRSLLKTTASRFGTTLTSKDYMDDGTPIQLSINIDPSTGSAAFDFTGTGPSVYGNTNAPPAVAYSAIIYCLRCLVDMEIPLNQGCLNPVNVIIEDGCLLKPGEDAAVVGGNVMTSQRVVDVVLKAFRACADSQGDCNNLTFGCENWGFYETIAGGSGAGPTWEGRSGVHTHMTNTRITDPEILERRYPVILRQFGLRPNSGGKGKHKGGDGVIRELEFTIPNIQVSILSERRVFQPHGLNGGENGVSGLNLLIRKSNDGKERVVNLTGKNTVVTNAGDRIRICTPGGAGYGKVE
ncbi:Hydantoinase B/oxoprolinase-domain-containing protein [Paraphysoderma sedebokerense]|nr:Hydantoinase B/oxoprolinase-domain-containing protein [Paraphysoderma sedebokerense]